MASLFALALCLLTAAAAMAAPLGPAGGELSAFAEYDSWFYDDYTFGFGYGFNENLTAGLFYLPDYEEFGVYANLALDQFRVNGELVLTDDYFGMVSALYVFDLDQFAVGLGGGFDFYEDADTWFFVEAAAEVALEPLTIYASYKYWPEDEAESCKIGVSIAF